MSDGIEPVSKTRTSQTYTPHSPMVIDSNDDFASQGWSEEEFRAILYD